MDKRKYEDLSGLTEEQKKERDRNNRNAANKRYRERKRAEQSGLPIPARLYVNEGKSSQEKRQRKLDLDKSYRNPEDSAARQEYLARERERKREAKKQYDKIWRILNKDKVNSAARERHRKNPNRMHNHNKKWYSTNSEAIKEKKKQFYDIKKQDLDWISKKRFRASTYHNRRKIEDPQFVARKALRQNLRNILKAYNVDKKSESIIGLIGCTIEQFVVYIEGQFVEGMTWTPKNFHLDHKRPCNVYDLTDPEQIKQCFHYSNYQPLWPSENLEKGAKLVWKRSPLTGFPDSDSLS